MVWLCTALAGWAGCAHVPPPAAAKADGVSIADVDRFIAGLVRPWPEASGPQLLAVSDAASERVSSYDNALLVLYWLRHGARAEAARVLSALAELQHDDGSIPFTFAWPRPESDEGYVRSGATAWVGYAAVEYLDADAAGPARESIARLAHRAAEYLMQQQLAAAGDPRDGLVRGGFGSYRYEPAADGGVVERYTPGPIAWTSIEHNLDAFFFLRDFGRLTGEARFAGAAERIRAALLARAWSESAGQLVRGLNEDGVDAAFALDCASWGALFLRAAGAPVRAETALATAELRFGAHARVRGVDVAGHRPYAHGPVIENRALAQRWAGRVPANWDDVDAVWPEGSAGVALAALRAGRAGRAREILAELEKLRGERGGLPTFTLAIPGEFDTEPSLGGTLWVELVRFELGRDPERPTLWRPS
jgi:hypothetical protein